MTPEEAARRAAERARERRAGGGYADADRLAGLDDDAGTDVQNLNEWALIEVDPDDVRSTRRFGAPITAFKHGVLRILRQYHWGLESQVTRFNVHMVAHVRALEERVEELERRLAEAERRPPP